MDLVAVPVLLFIQSLAQRVILLFYSGMTAMLKLVISASISSFFLGLFGVNWESVDEKIEREFPGVDYISTNELLGHYGEPVSSLPIIIDVRAPEEFAISHLQRALNLETEDSIAEWLATNGLSKDAAIIVYCSVGYRSAAVAQQLQQMGFTRVRNLKHSIFEWANKAYPMINASGETDKVHPFNRAWSVLLDESLHAYPAQ